MTNSIKILTVGFISLYLVGCYSVPSSTTSVKGTGSEPAASQSSTPPTLPTIIASTLPIALIDTTPSPTPSVSPSPTPSPSVTFTGTDPVGAIIAFAPHSDAPSSDGCTPGNDAHGYQAGFDFDGGLSMLEGDLYFSVTTDNYGIASMTLNAPYGMAVINSTFSTVTESVVPDTSTTSMSWFSGGSKIFETGSDLLGSWFLTNIYNGIDLSPKGINTTFVVNTASGHTVKLHYLQANSMPVVTSCTTYDFSGNTYLNALGFPFYYSIGQ